MQVQGKRKIGKPKTLWTDYIRDDNVDKEYNMTEGIAEHRSRWLSKIKTDPLGHYYTEEGYI